MTYLDSLDSTAEYFQKRVGGLPAQLGVVSLADGMRETPQQSKTRFRALRDGTVFFGTEQPEDLTGLSILLDSYLTEWERANESAPIDELVLYFESISMLLQYVDADRAARFLESVTTAFDRPGVTACFLVDPLVTDEGTLRRLTHLFDTIVDLTESE